ncbi:dihydrodipicolinate synthase family protein [Paenibacillus sp. IB182496]|uniref:Dihydrodipicolinate synthase family protein n=1 Tax=Paenibacillus sabuli TaxID=2772509 RepID=A0A927GSD7_9BACL|nr:dihydrodipicolinate synthase family protein [Paenibacillus sabuli]MBD2846629.1 dihydrodipicolinate synthase family protein [Paenibacillus sabuli]
MEQAWETKFEGVTVAMNACYDTDGEVDLAATKRLTRFLVDKGVQGLYVGGGTGEGLMQSVEERQRVLEAVAEENRGRLTLIAHVGAMNTRDSVALARHADTAGADAVSAIPPYYYSYSEQAVTRHWQAVMDGTSLPFIIYYIPASTGFHMSAAYLKELCQQEQLMGMKVTSFSTYELQQFKAAGGERFMVFNGPDQQYLAGRVMGASGGIGGTYGAMPELFVEIERCYRDNQMQEAQRWQVIVNDIITDMRALGLFGSLKALMRLRGVDCGEPRLPLPPLDPADRPAVLSVHDKIMRAVAACGKSAPVL